MSARPLRRPTARPVNAGPDVHAFVPPILRERVDPARAYADLDASVAASQEGRGAAVDGDQFLAELGAEIKRLKAGGCAFSRA